MSSTELLRKIQRGLRKPPKIIIQRIGQEAKGYADRYLAPQRAKKLGLKQLLKKTGYQNLNHLWRGLSKRPYFTVTNHPDLALFASLCPEDSEIIFQRAQLALEHKVDLLGSGLIELGPKINWHKDYKSQYDWPPKYIRDINYNNPERPSDVKFPWEVSRKQWFIPVGQAYLLTQDETYAQAAKELFNDWIDQNPYAFSVNWACTMEVALRILSWTWFFHVFKHSKAWQDQIFQQKFLTCLYLHADFTQRHLEFSDINGNHYTADAAGLVFAGLFFGDFPAANAWHSQGWTILCEELGRQVYADGVDFEASVPYHRLVLELFLLPACYREALQFKTPPEYQQSVQLMAEFTQAYSQPGGRVPLWGDADDARALPFGCQNINDHRYIYGLVGLLWDIKPLLAFDAGSFGEHFWLFGSQAVARIQAQQKHLPTTSRAFTHGGFFIMRNERDHIFIDCGPIGLAGRGGHGHNDCLSFEAVLDGVKLISDCGAYVYTASYEERNLFRSTQYHNTPCIDGQEINRFIRWDYLWNLHYDAKPNLITWQPGPENDLFCGSHSGYQNLQDPVTPKRTIRLDHAQHSLTIEDEILCKGQHQVSIPLHLAPNVQARLLEDEHSIMLDAGGKQFMLEWEGTIEWRVEISPARISPSYGITVASQKIVWHGEIMGSSRLKFHIKGEHVI